MNTYGLHRSAEAAAWRLFLAALFGVACFVIGYTMGEWRGYHEGVVARPCAEVKGEKVVSSSAGMCYYVKSSYGMTVRGRKAT